jgi:hypothetical protein
MPPNVVTELQQAPLPEMVERLGLAIAQAQFALDRNSIEIARILSDEENGLDLNDGAGVRSLLEMGFTPTFYQITDATIDVRVCFTSSQSEQFSIGGSIGVNVGFFAASINASYTAKYSFEASASSQIRARFISVPPPSLFAEILRSTIRRT